MGRFYTRQICYQCFKLLSSRRGSRLAKQIQLEAEGHRRHLVLAHYIHKSMGKRGSSFVALVKKVILGFRGCTHRTVEQGQRRSSLHSTGMIIVTACPALAG